MVAKQAVLPCVLVWRVKQPLPGIRESRRLPATTKGMPVFSIERGAKCVESQELAVVNPFSKDQEAIRARPPHSYWFENKKGRKSHALGTIQTRHTHSLWIQPKRKENNNLHWPATTMWLLYCFGTLDAMCTTSSITNWKDKKPQKIAMTNALSNCEPITLTILWYYFL